MQRGAKGGGSLFRRLAVLWAVTAVLWPAVAAPQNDDFDVFREFNDSLQCIKLLSIGNVSREESRRFALWTGSFVLGYLTSEFDDGLEDQLDILRLVENRSAFGFNLIIRCLANPDQSLLDIARTIAAEIREDIAQQ